MTYLFPRVAFIPTFIYQTHTFTKLNALIVLSVDLCTGTKKRGKEKMSFENIKKNLVNECNGSRSLYSS